MLSKEEIENYELFKNGYLQQPIISPMLTEENLKLLENHCINNRKNDIGKRFREHEIVLNLLYSYKELETNNKKLIEKLEECAKSYYTLNEDEEYVRNKDVEEFAQEILEIAKGEKE